jgi:hypothetical protein
MAIYKDKKYLSEFGDKAFDQDNEPGTAAPHSGIYRCAAMRCCLGTSERRV